jgi:hypothetical protein
VPYRARQVPRRPGWWKGQVSMDPDFDEPLPEFEQALER